MPARPGRLRLVSGSCTSARGFDSRFLPTLGRPHAVALHFVRCGQLTAGLSPTRLRPCWAHIKKPGQAGLKVSVAYAEEATRRTGTKPRE